jgi:hypothetical protein
MKKILLIIISIIGATTITNAQDADTDHNDRPQIGIKGGLNYSNVYDAQGQEFSADPKFGFAAGGYFIIPIVNFIRLQPEILYSQKGFTAHGSILGSSYRFSRTTHFIDVPLLFSLKPIDFVSIVIGPQYSFLIKQSDVFSSDFKNVLQEKEFENDNIRKNILCFIGGIDFNFDPFVFGARVGWDVMSNNGDGTSDTPRYKNVWYQATLGLRLSN